MATQPSGIQLIVGLGNPGPSYVETRHNAGAWFLKAFCQRYKIKLKDDPKFNARFVQATVEGRPIKAMISNTFMNLSGQALNAVAKYYHIPVEAILVAHDELDIPVGEVRFKTDGGHGGHNGLRDIISHLHSREFHRLRIGIGHPGDKDDVTDYVLKRPSSSDAEKINEGIENALDVLPLILAGDFQNAMSRLHTSRET